MQCIEGCLLYIPKYEIEAASGRLCRYQSMQEKLPVASSLYKIIHCQKYVCRHYAQKNISDILKSIHDCSTLYIEYYK